MLIIPMMLTSVPIVLQASKAILPTTLSVRATVSSTLCRRLMSSSNSNAETTNFVKECLPRAWRSIGWDNVMGGNENEALRNLFRDTLKEFGDGVTEEVRFNKAMMKNSNGDNDIQNTLPLNSLLEQYEQHRALSSGVTPCMAFACLFKPLSKEIYQNNDFRHLLRIASLIGGVDNDLQSQNKEEDWDRVSILVRCGGYSMDDAVEANCRRHYELVDEYERIATRLSQQYPEIDEWSAIVGPTMFRGFSSWQTHVKRYKNNNDRSLLEKLFHGQSYHVIQQDGTFEGLDRALHTDLSKDAFDWAKETGLITSQAKFEAINPALCTLLLYDYYSTPKDIAALQAFTKVFLVLLVADDFWEKPEYHALTKKVMFDCFDNDL